MPNPTHKLALVLTETQTGIGFRSETLLSDEDLDLPLKVLVERLVQPSVAQMLEQHRQQRDVAREV